jgi:hypothetical protein
MRDALLNLIRSEPPGDSLFNQIALQIYQYQLEHNPPYRQFCLLGRKSIQTIHRWEDIPALPVTAFKSVDIACRPIQEATHLFHSSGTLRDLPGHGKSRHYLFDDEIAKAAILSHFNRHLCPQKKMRLCILTPSPEEAPHSSLSYMMGVIREAYGTKESEYYIHRGRLLGEKLAFDLSEATEPIFLLGTSFAFVHFIDFHEERSFPIVLPHGSRLMDTGGFKGRSRIVSKHWLYAMIQKRLGISPEYCINEYGMSEITSQFYDGILGRDAPRLFYAPPQVRWQILSTETLKPVKKGEVGLLALYDLANIDSVLALLTEDLGREVAGGIDLTGRAANADLKGCSIALDAALGTASPPL